MIQIRREGIKGIPKRKANKNKGTETGKHQLCWGRGTINYGRNDETQKVESPN